jgi:hypothetical protein
MRNGGQVRSANTAALPTAELQSGACATNGIEGETLPTSKRPTSANSSRNGSPTTIGTAPESLHGRSPSGPTVRLFRYQIPIYQPAAAVDGLEADIGAKARQKVGRQFISEAADLSKIRSDPTTS